MGLEVQRISQGLEHAFVADEALLTKLTALADDPRSTSIVCFGLALTMLQAHRFRSAVSVAFTAYKSSFDKAETWTDCARFMELIDKASAEGLMVNDLPDWCSLMLMGEGADLASVPEESVQGVVEWVQQGDLQQRAQLLKSMSSTSETHVMNLHRPCHRTIDATSSE